MQTETSSPLIVNPIILLVVILTLLGILATSSFNKGCAATPQLGDPPEFAARSLQMSRLQFVWCRSGTRLSVGTPEFNPACPVPRKKART